MGLLANSVSFVRYHVAGPFPDNFWQLAAERLPLFAFRDIDDNYEELAVGWVAIENMFDSDFAYSSYAVGDYLVLSMRVDERKVAPAVLKKFCLKEEERIKKAEQRPRLSRAEKLEIKERVRLLLVKRAMPTATVYDCCWNLAEGTVLFFSTNQKARELFQELFKETFGLAAALQIPFVTAGHLLGEEAEASLEGLSPTIFV